MSGCRSHAEQVGAYVLGVLEPDEMEEMRAHLPFPVRKVQCDNGREFPLAFKLAVEAAGMRGLLEGQTVTFELQRDQRSGKMSATNLQAG